MPLKKNVKLFYNPFKNSDYEYNMKAYFKI
jgi:hypothetical protein